MALFLCALTSFAYTWQEDPRIEEHNKLITRLIKLGDEQAASLNKETVDLLNLMISEREKLEEGKNE